MQCVGRACVLFLFFPPTLDTGWLWCPILILCTRERVSEWENMFKLFRCRHEEWINILLQSVRSRRQLFDRKWCTSTRARGGWKLNLAFFYFFVPRAYVVCSFFAPTLCVHWWFSRLLLWSSSEWGHRNAKSRLIRIKWTCDTHYLSLAWFRWFFCTLPFSNYWISVNMGFLFRAADWSIAKSLFLLWQLF